MRLVLFVLLFARVAHGCPCAPLASCVRHANGTLGCVCPYLGDGYRSCEEQRFVTDVAVRTKSDSALGAWLNEWAIHARVGHVSQRKLLSETQYVLELDSTNHEAMVALTEEINSKGWPYQVALLGSATSRIVLSAAVEESPPLLEVVNVSYNGSWWELELVMSDGTLFLSSEIAPLPCIHAPSSCCASEYLYYPFRVGSKDAEGLERCTFPVSNGTQALGARSRFRSHFSRSEDGAVVLRIDESELAVLTLSDADSANFSVGVISEDAATQVQVSLRRGSFYHDYSVGTFTRQIASYVMMQVEQVGEATYLRVFAHVSLENASVAYVQYAWGDMEWIVPDCAVRGAQCFDVPTPCQASARNGLLELWVPVANHSVDRGNITVYFVLRQGATLARVVTIGDPHVAARHCAEALEVQLLQGLSLKEIYRGSASAVLRLDVEPQTDTLVTLVARGAIIEDLQAIHTSSEAEVHLVSTAQPCPTCVAEQLVLAGKVVTPRSCFLFGAGDEAAWIQSYVGLAGSRLALDVLGKIPADVKAGAASAAWVNPAWPTANMTFLHANFRNVHRSRKLMESSAIREKWCVVTLTATLLFAWHLYQMLYIIAV